MPSNQLVLPKAFSLLSFSLITKYELPLEYKSNISFTKILEIGSTSKFFPFFLYPHGTLPGICLP